MNEKTVETLWSCGKLLMKCISPVLSDTMAGWLAGWLGGKRKSKGNLYLFLTFEQAVVE